MQIQAVLCCLPHAETCLVASRGSASGVEQTKPWRVVIPPPSAISSYCNLSKIDLCSSFSAMASSLEIEDILLILLSQHQPSSSKSHLSEGARTLYSRAQTHPLCLFNRSVAHIPTLAGPMTPILRTLIPQTPSTVGSPRLGWIWVCHNFPLFLDPTPPSFYCACRAFF